MASLKTYRELEVSINNSRGPVVSYQEFKRSQSFHEGSWRTHCLPNGPIESLKDSRLIVPLNDSLEICDFFEASSKTHGFLNESQRTRCSSRIPKAFKESERTYDIFQVFRWTCGLCKGSHRTRSIFRRS